MAKKKRKRSGNSHNRQKRRYSCNQQNKHHLLFPGKAWARFEYSRKLREHPYFKKFVPEYSLHKDIHNLMWRGIPVPPEDICRKAYYEFLRRYNERLVDEYRDTLERRLQVLIDLFAECPKTVAALKMQQELAIKFYKNGRM